MAVIYGAPPVDEPDMDKWGPKILEYLKTRLDLSMVKDSNQASRYAVSSVDGSNTPSLTGSGSGQNPPASIVTSFIGRTGDIQPESEDYSAFYLGKTATAVAASELSPGAEINGVNFTGASNITVAAAADTLTGTTLASNVVNSSLTSVADNAITNAMLAEMPAETIKGNDTAATADAIDLTAAQVTAMLNPYSGSAQGLVPAGAGGTTNYLREDGTWAEPSGGGGMTNPMTTAGDIITGGVSGAPQRLGIGTSGSALVAKSGAPVWGTLDDIDDGEIRFAVVDQILSRASIGVSNALFQIGSGSDVPPGWVLDIGNGKFSYPTGAIYGTQYLQILSTDLSPTRLYSARSYGVLPGDILTVYGAGMAPGSGQTAYIGVEFFRGDGTQIAPAFWVSLDSGSLANFTGTTTVPPDCAYIRPALYQQPSAIGQSAGFNLVNIMINSAPTLSSITINGGTVYQNTSGRWMTLMTSTTFSNTGIPTAQLQIGPSSPPGVVVGSIVASPSQCFQLSGRVPPGWYYELIVGNPGSGSNTIQAAALYEN